MKVAAVIIVGVIGGIGSGKSAICRWVAQRDPSVRVIDADGDGHRALALPEVQAALRAEFGAGVFRDDGQVDRAALASRVFGDDIARQQARGRLEAIVHPAIARLREAQLEAMAAAGQVRVALVDAAVLLEAGWQHRCDKVVYVDVPRSLRLNRVLARGWDDVELARREASQWPADRKRGAADFVVDNSGTLDNAGRQMYEYIKRLVASAGK